MSNRTLRSTETTQSIQLGDRELTYVLRRTNQRRTIGLTVNHDGLKVASPWYIPMADITAMIEKSQDWVFNKLEIWQAQQPFARQWINGETLYFLGKEIRLQVDLSLLGHGAFLSRDILMVYAATPASVSKNAITWYREQALKYFYERINEIAPHMQLIPHQLALSNAKHQWGCCNSKGEIRLNWRLIQAAPAVIDYVIVHELAHLKHMNHSPRFWATVESACPEYRQLREELKQKDVFYRTM